MDKKYNLSQLADLLAQAGGMSKSASEQFVKNFFDIISQNVLADGLVKVKGLGTFKLIRMEDRESVNVNTGERFTIEGHQKISFTPDAELKERVNKPFAAFETTEITAEQAAELSKMDQEQADETADSKVVAAAVVDKKESVQDKETEKEAVQESKKESKKSKEEKEEKEEKKNNVCVKLFIWLLSIILVLALLIFLLWPVIGGRILGVMGNSVPEEKAPVPEVVAPEKAPQTAPAATAPQPATTTAPQPASSTTPSSGAPAAQPAAKDPAKFTLVKSDQDKALELFTYADTVNYRITGTQTVHTMIRGDMLTTISLRYYGTKKLWPYIAKYNGLNPRTVERLPIGYKIKVPKLANK